MPPWVRKSFQGHPYRKAWIRDLTSMGVPSPDIPEGSFLEDEDEDPIPPSITTTIATSEQSTGSCDTSPDTVSPSLSPGFEDLSHIRPGSPAINGHSQTDDEEETHGE